MKDYWKLAIINLRHRGIRSWLTLLGIFIGITAVVSLISLGAGLKLAVDAQFGISATEIITVQAGGVTGFGAPGSGVVDKLTLDDVDAIQKLSSVEIAIPRIISSSKMEFRNRVEIGMAASVPDGKKRKLVYEIMDIEAVTGRLLKDGDTNKVVLGYNFWTDDKIYGKVIVPGNKVLIMDKKFEVVGITKKSGSFILDNIIMMNEDQLRNLMNYSNDVDLIAVRIKDKDLMERAAKDIEKLMRDRRNVDVGKEDFEVSTPEAMLETVSSIIGGIQIFIVIIASISILVGALGIINTMTTSVLERRKEIGIMKAVGAKNSQIFAQFFIESGLLGLVGGVAGVIVGVAIGYFGTLGIGNFIGTEISPSIDFSLIIAVLIGSFVVGSVSGLIPAMNAAKQNPVEALRG